METLQTIKKQNLSLVKNGSRIEKALQSIEVRESLSTIEYKVCKLKTGIKIKDMNENIFIENIGKTCYLIATMVGIKNIEVTDITIFKRFVKMYYSYFSIAEINLAFDLALIGELDQYLPKNSNGNPDRNHYQQFSIDYVTKILNAFKRKQQAIVSKAYKSLPDVKKEISIEQKTKYENNLINDISLKFYEYKNKGKKPSFLVNHLVMLFLKSNGIIENIPVPQENALQLAFDSILSKKERVNNYTFHKILKDKANKVDNSDLKKIAYKYECVKIVCEWFDSLIKENKTVKDYLHINTIVK